jgi:hypothetical protein
LSLVLPRSVIAVSSAHVWVSDSVFGGIDDGSNTHKLQLIAAGLGAIGLFLLVFTVWFWRSTRADHSALGPLEVMGARRWRNAPVNDQLTKLAEVRPIGSAMGGADRPLVDLAELVADHRSSTPDQQGGGFSDLIDGEPQSLTPEDEWAHEMPAKLSVRVRSTAAASAAPANDDDGLKVLGIPEAETEAAPGEVEAVPGEVEAAPGEDEAVSGAVEAASSEVVSVSGDVEAASSEVVSSEVGDDVPEVDFPQVEAGSSQAKSLSPGDASPDSLVAEDLPPVTVSPEVSSEVESSEIESSEVESSEIESSEIESSEIESSEIESSEIESSEIESSETESPETVRADVDEGDLIVPCTADAVVADDDIRAGDEAKPAEQSPIPDIDGEHEHLAEASTGESPPVVYVEPHDTAAHELATGHRLGAADDPAEVSDPTRVFRFEPVPPEKIAEPGSQATDSFPRFRWRRRRR